MKRVLAAILLAAASLVLAPSAHADMRFGNYDLVIPARYDFHTWVWWIMPCAAAKDCVQVRGIPRPVAKAYSYQLDAPLIDGKYVLTADVPDGLRCGDVYYGPVVATHDVYTWDPTTLTGVLQSSFDSGCDGNPGVLTYPFNLVRL